MKCLVEVTGWDTEVQPNHTYLVSGDKMIAYRPHHTGPVEWFKHPMRLNRARRRFEERAVCSTEWGIESAEDPAVVTVQGSRGNNYEVNIQEKTCSCTGYRFHGRCRHLDQVIADQGLTAA